MKRRSFLGAMLASFTAPYVMSGGLGRGILMPGKATPAFAMSDGGVLVPSNFVGPMLRLFTEAGILLASIPLSKQQQALFDYGRSVSMNFAGHGDVIRTGVAARYEVDLSDDVRHKGEVNQGNFPLQSTAFVVGQNVTIPSMLVSGPQARLGGLVDVDGDPL